MESTIKTEPIEQEQAIEDDNFDDLTDLIRRAESIIQENRERVRQNLSNSERLRAQAIEMIRDQSFIIELNDTPEAPEALETATNNSPSTEKDDDVVFVAVEQRPVNNNQVIDLSTPNHTAPKRRRRIPMHMNFPEGILAVEDVHEIVELPSNALRNEQTRKDPALNTSTSSNSGEAGDSLRLKCPICLDKFRKPNATLCGHIYCEKCIKAAIHSTKKCPLCNRKLAPKSIHPLYFN